MSKTVVVGVPGVPTRLQDIVSVAKGALVELDQNAAQRIKKESPAPSAFTPEPASPEAPSTSDSDLPLTALERRAATFVALLAVVNGKSGVRLQVVDKVLSLLNDNPDEVSKSQGTCAGNFLFPQLTTNRADQPFPISKAERAFLSMPHLPAAGVGALAVVSARQLQRTSLAVTALSCEALQADVRDLEVDRVESICTPAAASMAAGVRDMLNESGRINAKKGGSGPLNCLLEVPAAQGALDEVVSRLEQMIQVIISASASTSALVEHLRPSQGLGLGLNHLVSSFISSIELSNEATAQACLKAGAPDNTIPKLLSRYQESLAAWKQSNKDNRDSTLRSAHLALQSGSFLCEAHAMQALAAIRALKSQDVLDYVPVAAGDKAAAKSKKKSKSAGNTLGIGTSKFRNYLNNVVESAAITNGAQTLRLEQGDENIHKDADEAAMCQILDPLNEQLGRELDLLQQLVESNAKLRKPKVAKGARDFMPEQMAIRDQAFKTIAGVFELHGAVAIDTPVFELKETLTGKYGEDSKLIYDLKDQGGELLSLRYDLTVPFARYVALNGITNIKRYHIAKVYRRDQPQAARGRFREFYQCDFDVAGSSPLMVADAEVLKVLTEILAKLDLGHFTVKINHRALLDGMMSLCGVPAGKFRTICSAIDKLDKESWETVRTEMVEDKGLDAKAADKIGTFVGSKGEPKALLAQLASPGHDFAADESCSKALSELEVLFDLLDMMGALHHFSFDLSLARGLDYYTGVIYEAVMQGTNVGSIAAGGRYDNLVGMFSSKQVPAVGVSLGIERIFSVLEEKHRREAAASNGSIRETKTQVLVMSASKDMQAERIRLASELWAHSIAAEFGYKANPFMPEQMSYASTSGIPLCVVLRPEELKQGTVELMETLSGAKEVVRRKSIVQTVASRIKELGPLSLVVPGRPESNAQ